MEQLDFNVLLRWVVGLNQDAAILVPAAFTKHGDPRIAGHIADAFVHEVLKDVNTRGRSSHERFTVVGTLLEACASQTSFRRKNGTTSPPTASNPKNRTVNFRGDKRSNTAHESIAERDARLSRKTLNTAAVRGQIGSALPDNRYGLITGTNLRDPATTRNARRPWSSWSRWRRGRVARASGWTEATTCRTPCRAIARARARRMRHRSSTRNDLAGWSMGTPRGTLASH